MSAGSIFTKNRGDGGLRFDKLNYIITVRARTACCAEERSVYDLSGLDMN
jgi:hypothetical protein